MEDNHIEKKSRGGCLTAYLILLIIVEVIGIIGAIRLLSLDKSTLPPEIAAVMNFDPITNYVSIIVAVLGLIGAILIFMWKKWGVYLYIASMVISLVVAFLTTPDTKSLIYSIVGTAIGLGIFYLLIRNVYKHLK